MEVTILGAAQDAMGLIFDPFRLMMLGAGVLMGLFLGLVPGIGGLAGMALLLPFTFTMDPYTAFAMLLGMAAVVGTSDTIPAVMFGVPGTAGAQATIMDGNPMAKRGEAGRALSAAFTASLFGGLMGAVMLAVMIPVLRPLMLHIGSPELLALSVLGIAMVAVLSGNAPLRGLIAAGLGILLSMIGADSQTGTLRWTMGTFYLWDGLPIVPLVLGLFALPELADLVIRRRAIAQGAALDTKTGMWTGFMDVMRNKWLTVRCGTIGAALGAIPGMGSAVVDWIAYGHAIQTVKDARKTFGKGDVRGVIAPEAANNSITAGALVPTIAFGVPGSASMAILLGVFLIHGMVPGPAMLNENLVVTYTMVWSIAIANILGAGICFLFSGQLARIAILRYTLIIPAVLIFVYVGAFQASRNWGDLYALVGFGVVGWIMKQMRWPRPPLILGFVLGALIERYLFISVSRYGLDWLARPMVMGLFAIAFFILAGPVWRHLKAQGWISGILRDLSRPRFKLSDLLYGLVFALVVYLMTTAINWPWGARVGPLTVGIITLVFCGLSFANQTMTRGLIAARTADADNDGFHMDTTNDYSDLTTWTVLRRALVFLGYLLLFMASMKVVGLIPTVPFFVALFMWAEGRENLKLILGQCVFLTAAVYLIFDRLLTIPWPKTLLSEWIPALTIIPSV
ncbi:tripartite tricarboxylate transporter permease [Roseicitreum antarcticum]|uniref:TctA family transporter n=1 Tax=Roseicitreum antarcticum TaxID=564137 RepID=A0A1H2W1F1_9RHOB|nr:tripartite tricarboxylate transporter permease [Roseicitreum antarcticum]SDW74326.1 TctA family transporter [Roseicitreum antarcticum]